MESRHRSLSLSRLNRRSAVGRAGAIAAVLGLSSRIGLATAQEATPADLANHPIVGAWNAMTPGGPSLAVFSADGTATFANPTTAADPDRGVIYQTASVGTWEPTGPRSIHFTATLVVTDVNGVHIGYWTNDAYPVVSEDGQSLVDDQAQGNVTIRDAAGTIVQEFATAGAPPVTGSRMGVGSPGFPTGTPPAGTPTT
jgi:hypothetical protein